MPEVKVLHMADMHLEWPFASLNVTQGRVRRAELKETFQAIIDLACAEQVRVLLIAGDLYEHALATRGAIKFMDDQFRRIPQTSVFISPGNHDPFLAESYYRTYAWAPNVHIFGPQVNRVDLPDLPVSVYGWGFGAWEVPDFQLGALRITDPARVNLVVVHGGEGAYHPFRAADLSAIGADYIALGHIHKEGVVLEERGRVIARYSGSPEALGFGEPGEHGVYVGTVGKNGSAWRFAPTGRRRYVTQSVDIGGALSAEDVMDRLLAVGTPAERARHLYRLTVTGAVDPEVVSHLPTAAERLASDFFVLRLNDGTTPAVDLDELAAEQSARGLFVRRLLAMEQGFDDPALQRRVQRALTLGLAALTKGGTGR